MRFTKCPHRRIKEVFMPVNRNGTTAVHRGSPQRWINDMADDENHGAQEVTVDPDGYPRARFSAKEVIYRESERISRIYLIRSGLVKLLSYLPNGRARIVRLHSTGHWIGLEGIVGQPYEHTAIAVGDVEACCIPMSRLRLLERENPKQYFQILGQGYKHLAQADKWIAEFSTGGVKPRVARLVDFLSKLEHGESSHIVELLTVHDMADILGVTAESVSRTLAAFKRSDILHRQGSYLNELYHIDAGKLQEEARQ
jgi:CRP/FNR family transcriptional regulator